MHVEVDYGLVQALYLLAMPVFDEQVVDVGIVPVDDRVVERIERDRID